MKTLKIFPALFIAMLINNFLFAQCAPPTAQADLDIANVRARILCGGDMWWDAVAQQGPKYEVPINSGQHAMFAGSIWIGGLDASGNLHLAAQTYRQGGQDFWPGPLDTISASVSPGICQQYDRLWKITRQEVIDFIGGAPATNAINTWPGNGNTTAVQSHYLAPFHDSNSDGIYNPANGDYPDFGFTAPANCCNILHGDQAIWWVINDAGNIHTATGGAPFGIEIQCQAFAYLTNDSDINNTTFYQYILINRSSNTYHSTYFGIWADPDLGNYLDDYVGCDVGRGMGYCYNGVAAPSGFYQYPPAIGIDILRGPLADAGDGIDNNRNGVTDEPGEDIIMSNFQYYNNDFSVTGNPTDSLHYYNYLKSIWKDGTPVTYGGNGYGGSTPATFMYPYNSDPTGWGTGGIPQPPWSEVTTGNTPSDRRFLMSAGPFTMQPGEVNCITVATVWARDMTGAGPYYSLAALQAADDKVQMFFDSCFNINVLGIADKENIRASVYPNPVSDMLEINFGRVISDGQFILYDIFGKTIKTVAVKNKNNITVSCKEFAAGIYVYRIILADGKTSSGKVVIK